MEMIGLRVGPLSHWHCLDFSGCVFFSSRRRHTRCTLVTGVQTCALPICISAGLAIARKGIDWTHKLRAQADYQRTNGKTSVERYLAELEPQYRIDERTFAFGLGRWEHDRILGYDTRSEEHTSELQSLMRNSYAVFCLIYKKSSSLYEL